MMETRILGKRCPPEVAEVLRTSRNFLKHAKVLRYLSSSPGCSVEVVQLCGVRTPIVLKTYILSGLNADWREKIDVEATLHSLSSALNPNIVGFYFFVEDACRKYVAMEYAGGGDLAGFPGPHHEGTIRQRVVAPILSSLATLQEQGIVHRDVKPENIFIHEGMAKLGDFGLATQCPPCEDMHDDMAGTPLYLAPELVENRLNARPIASATSFKNDVWSLGLVVFWAVTGQHPFGKWQGASCLQLLLAIATHQDLTIPTHLDPDLQDWLRQALAKDPSKRATVEHLSNHPWMQKPLSCGGTCSMDGWSSCLSQEGSISGACLPSGARVKLHSSSQSCYSDASELLCFRPTTGSDEGEATTVAEVQSTMLKGKRSSYQNLEEASGQLFTWTGNERGPLDALQCRLIHGNESEVKSAHTGMKNDGISFHDLMQGGRVEALWGVSMGSQESWEY